MSRQILAVDGCVVLQQDVRVHEMVMECLVFTAGDDGTDETVVSILGERAIGVTRAGEATKSL